MNDKRTLVIDGNFMLKRMLRDYTFMVDPLQDRIHYLIDLSQHFAAEIERVKPFVDNVVMCRDSHSWRKDVQVIQQLDNKGNIKQDQSYKANRKQSEDRDWKMIYDTFSEFCDCLQSKFSVPTIQVMGAEGDDCIWAVTEYLAKHKTKAAVYCTDSDLNQLVTPSTVILRRIKSKASPEGEIIVHKRFWDLLNKPVSDDPFDLFDTSHTKWQTDLAMLNGKSLEHGIIIAYPFWSALKLMILGSPKDNVPELFSWPAKSVRRHINVSHIEMALALMGKSKTDVTEKDLYDEAFLITLLINLCYTTKQTHLQKNISHYYKMLVSNRKLNYLSSKEIPQKIQEDLFDRIDMAMQTYKQADMENLNKWTLISEALEVSGDKMFQKFGI